MLLTSAFWVKEPRMPVIIEEKRVSLKREYMPKKLCWKAGRSERLPMVSFIASELLRTGII